jgi:hypothetical protein
MASGYTDLLALGVSSFNAITIGKGAGITAHLGGISTTAAAIVAEIGTVEPPVGSKYYSTNGTVWEHFVAGTTAACWRASQQADVTTGTILTGLQFNPKAAAATSGITGSHKLVSFGDVTGNTAFGFGHATVATTGLMGCFGRTVLATGSQTDTGADFRVINKLVDTTGVHSMQGAYIKAKNYSGATLTGNLYGMFIECVADGTVSGTAYPLKLGKDGTTITGDILFTNGLTLFASTAAITANSTATSLAAGSIGFTSNGTGVGKLFVSDGSKWQYAGVA